MNRLQRLKNRAHRMGVHVMPAYEAPGLWDVYNERETILGPRGLAWTKRRAVHLAHAITIAPRVKLTITEQL